MQATWGVLDGVGRNWSLAACERAGNLITKLGRSLGSGLNGFHDTFYLRGGWGIGSGTRYWVSGAGFGVGFQDWRVGKRY